MRKRTNGEKALAAAGARPAAREISVFARLMGLKTISPLALHEEMRSGMCSIIDVNPRIVWMQAHVPGASNLDPNYEESALPPDKNAMLVFYCSNPMCRKAPNAARRAKKIGYENVVAMSAGISGWLAAQLPTESDE